MKVCISGPMTGYPELNRQEFATARALLADLGHEPVDPRDADVPEPSWAAYVRVGASRGATLEVHIAQQLGLPVLPIAAWAGVPA